MAPAGYEPRKMKGMGLAFATTPRGACHLRATFYKPELLGFIDPQTGIEGKAEIYFDWEDRLTIMDTLVYCRFYRDMVPWPYITAVVNAAIGTDYSDRRPARLANRIVTETHRLQRAARLPRPHQGEAARLDHRSARPTTRGQHDRSPGRDGPRCSADYYQSRLGGPAL